MASRLINPKRAAGKTTIGFVNLGCSKNQVDSEVMLGALVASGYDFARAQQMRRECRYLINLHGIGRIVLLMHGPVAGGPAEAACADYRRKLPRSSVEQLREQQTVDANQLLRQRTKWAGLATVVVYRCEIDVGGAIAFVDLAASSESRRVRMTST